MKTHTWTDDEQFAFGSPTQTNTVTVGSDAAAYETIDSYKLTDATFAATYDSSIDADWGDGTLTGAAVNGAAVSGGKLVLTSNDIRYVDYDADLNADGQQVGTVRFLVTPNYSGTPVATQCFLTILKANADSDNELYIRHASNGNLLILINDSAGNIIVSFSAAWSPIAGTEYEIELNYDLTAGITRVFIDGTQLGSTNASTGTRDSSIVFLRVGSDRTPTLASNFSMNNVLIFSTVQHTAAYTPGETTTGTYISAKVSNEVTGATLTMTFTTTLPTGTSITFYRRKVNIVLDPNYTWVPISSGDTTVVGSDFTFKWRADLVGNGIVRPRINSFQVVES